MILKHYLIKDVFTATLAVLGFLTLLMLGGRLIRYFGMAATGGLDVGILFALVGYKLATFLVLILPLSFFIGLMLVLGRLYVEQEMTVLQSAGVSPRRFALGLWPLVLALVLVEAVFSLHLAAWGERKSEAMFREQAIKSAFDLVQPKNFIRANQYSLYVGSVDKQKGSLGDIVLLHKDGGKDIDGNPRDVIITAKRAVQVASHSQEYTPNAEQTKALAKELGTSAETASKVEKVAEHVTMLDLFEGRRYELGADNLAYNQIEFSQYRLRLAKLDEAEVQTYELEAQSLPMLTASLPAASAKAELGFRFAMPLTIVLAWVLAVPLAKVRPRQGRWLRLLPAILLFATSVVALMSLKNTIAKDKLTIAAYFGVLALYVGLAVFAYNKNKLKRKIAQKTSARSPS